VRDYFCQAPLAPLPKQRQLPLLDIEALEGVHNRGHGGQRMVRLVMGQLAGLDPGRVAAPSERQLALRFGNLFGQGVIITLLSVRARGARVTVCDGRG